MSGGTRAEKATTPATWLAWLDGQLPDDGRSRGSAAQAVGNQAYR
jgi:hypothetical protein